MCISGVCLSCLYDIRERQLHNNNARGINIQLHAHQLHINNCWGINCVIIPAPMVLRWHVCRVNFARKIFFEPRIFVRKMLRNFPRIFWAFVLWVRKIPGKFPPNFPLNFPNFPAKNLKKFTDELLQERRENMVLDFPRLGDLQPYETWKLRICSESVFRLCLTSGLLRVLSATFILSKNSRVLGAKSWQKSGLISANLG